MPKDELLYLRYMRDAAHKAVAKTEDIDRATYDEDENLQLALVHLVLIIGEAARRVTITVRETHPDIPWREITGLRHKMLHDYFGIDDDVVWAVATQDLPALIIALDGIDIARQS